MLIDHSAFLRKNFILDMIAAVNGNSEGAARIDKGIYLIGHFGSSDFPGREFKEWISDLKDSEGEWFGEYGVCDNYQQILDKCPMLGSLVDRSFTITLTQVRKSDQPAEGGWRWHKWGTYIGTHEIQHEYLYDEKGIESVYVYHIYEYNRGS